MNVVIPVRDHRVVLSFERLVSRPDDPDPTL